MTPTNNPLNRTTPWVILAVLMLAALACNTPTTQPTQSSAVTLPPPTATVAEAAEEEQPPPTEEPPTQEEDSPEPPTDAPETEPSPSPGSPVSYQAFHDSLLDALTRRDYDSMQAKMGDPFIFALWRSESYETSPAEAIVQLRENYLPPEAYIDYYLGEDLKALLGTDPLTMWGPDVEVSGAVRFTGWGKDGETEALIIIARRPDGMYYWRAVLLAPGGFN